MDRLPVPRGHCIVKDCGRILRLDNPCEFCDSHWQLIPLDTKRALIKHGKSSAKSAHPGRRQTTEYHKARQEALDHIHKHQRGYTGSMGSMIADRDLSTK